MKKKDFRSGVVVVVFLLLFRFVFNNLYIIEKVKKLLNFFLLTAVCVCACVFIKTTITLNMCICCSKKRQILDFQWNKQTKKKLKSTKISCRYRFVFSFSHILFFFFFEGKKFFIAQFLPILLFFLHLHPTTRIHIHTQFYWRECDLVQVKKNTDSVWNQRE